MNIVERCHYCGCECDNFACEACKLPVWMMNTAQVRDLIALVVPNAKNVHFRDGPGDYVFFVEGEAYCVSRYDMYSRHYNVSRSNAGAKFDWRKYKVRS